MENLFALTRKLVDIESVSGNETALTAFLFDELSQIVSRYDGRIERMAVEGDRCNLFASWGQPVVTFSTHMDTVPPFFASAEDDEFIRGRGSCDAKGIIAAMMGAAERLLRDGQRNLGLLFVAGEERDSIGAKAAARQPRGSKYLINGEPTENHLALAAKGALRLEISAAGRMAHSAYPELGESAIERLLDALEALRKVSLPADELLGPTTINIGTISGGRAPNVVADAAKAEVFVRLVGDPGPVREAVSNAVRDRAHVKETGYTSAMRFERVDGLPTTVVSYVSDAPVLSPAWGKPLLIGPGSIRVAHTERESVSKRQLADAVRIYADLAAQLLPRD